MTGSRSSCLTGTETGDPTEAGGSGLGKMQWDLGQVSPGKDRWMEDPDGRPKQGWCQGTFPFRINEHKGLVTQG